MLVKNIIEIPDEFFSPALEEIRTIHWDSIHDPRSMNNIFNDSKSISLRSSKIIINDTSVASILENSKVTECLNNDEVIRRFVAVHRLSNFIYKYVGGIALGKIMIVNINAGGKVPLHIDPNDYFEKYSRYHVPFKTNELVLISGDKQRTTNEHMPYKHLCRLNNRLPHSVYNDSTDNRIHLIVDIETSGGNQIF